MHKGNAHESIFHNIMSRAHIIYDTGVFTRMIYIQIHIQAILEAK